MKRLFATVILCLSIISIAFATVEQQADISSLLATILRSADSRTYTEKLAELATHENNTIATAAILALGRIADPRGVRHLQYILKYGISDRASLAAYSMGEMARPYIYEVFDEKADSRWHRTLEGYLKDPRPGVAAACVRALGIYKDQRSVRVLLELLNEQQQSKKPDPSLTRELLITLMRIKDPETKSAITIWLHSSNPEIRRLAAMVSGRMDNSDAIPDLIQLLSDPEPPVGIEACMALARLSAPVPEIDLQPFLNSSDPQAQIAAIRLTAKIRPNSAVRQLIIFLPQQGQPETQTAFEVIEALANIGDLRAVPALWKLAEHKDSLGYRALIALGELKYEKAIYRLAKLDEAQDYEELGAMSMALAKLGTEQALNQLVKFGQIRPRPLILKDARARMAWVQAVIEAKPDRLSEFVSDWLHDSSPIVRAMACETLSLSGPNEQNSQMLADALRQAKDDSVPDAALAAVSALEITAEKLSPGDPIRERVLWLVQNELKRAEQSVVRQAARTLFHLAGRKDRHALFGAAIRMKWQDYLDAAQRIEKEHPMLCLETDKGEIKIRMFTDLAPVTCANILKLVQEKFYDGLVFHRVVPNFVIQTGDPTGTGWGGPGYTIRCETTSIPFKRGIVGMAHAGKDTGGSQFFITLWTSPHLDGYYTAWGDIISGIEVADSIVPGDKIKQMRLLSLKRRG